MKRVLTVTLNPAIDMSGVAEVVRPTRKTRLGETLYEPGGGGINVARVMKALGTEADALYLAGGETGALLDRLVADQGIRGRRIPCSGQTRIAFMVRERQTGLEYRFIPAGSPVAGEDIEACLRIIAEKRDGYLVLSGSLPTGAPADTFARLAAAVDGRPVRVVLDTSGPALAATLSARPVFLVKPSRGELEQLAGRSLDDHALEREASAIVARGEAKLVAVTLGADGAILASADGVLRLPALAVRVRSAAGAGDSFLGAMVWGLVTGRPVAEAFRLGIAAGAAAAMTPGTQLCRGEDILALFAQFPAADHLK